MNRYNSYDMEMQALANLFKQQEEDEKRKKEQQNKSDWMRAVGDFTKVAMRPTATAAEIMAKQTPTDVSGDMAGILKGFADRGEQRQLDSSKSALQKYQWAKQMGEARRGKEKADMESKKWEVSEVRNIKKDFIDKREQSLQNAESAYKMMQQSVRGGGILDIASIYNLFRSLDPGGRVTEGEVGMVGQARALKDEWDMLMSKLARKEDGTYDVKLITDKQKVDMLNLSRLAVQIYQNLYDSGVDSARSYATTVGVRPQFVEHLGGYKSSVAQASTRRSPAGAKGKRPKGKKRNLVGDPPEKKKEEEENWGQNWKRKWNNFMDFLTIE